MRCAQTVKVRLRLNSDEDSSRVVTIVIADLTYTTLCHRCGAQELVLAHKKAAAEGIELRLVTPWPAVRRIIELAGLDQLLAVACQRDAGWRQLAIYLSLDAALAAGTTHNRRDETPGPGGA